MIILIILIILVLLSFNLFRNFFKNDETILDDVKLKSDQKNKGFALMVEQKNNDGTTTYVESTNGSWPSNDIYFFNNELSGCVDMKGNKLDNVLSFDSNTNLATVKTNTTTFCYLYFDKDKVAPKISIFYLGGSSNPTYATSRNTTVYLTWNDSDVASSCLTTTNSSSNCTWTTTSGTSVTANYTLTSGDGTKIVYAYLKDKAGNISSSALDTIILDTTKPTISKFYLGGSSNPTYATNTSTTAYITWSDSDVASYCLTTTNSSANCTWTTTSVTSVTASYTLTSGDETKTVYAFLKDKAGNISSGVSDTITLDTTKPTISSVTKTSDETTSITIKVTASDTNGIATYYYQIGSNGVVNNTTGTYTFSGLAAGTSYTIKVYVKDKAGNTSSTKSYTFKTKSNSLADYLISNVSSDVLWKSTLEDDGYRYVGTAPNNYICFGTSDKDTCTSNKDKYMYRIIGIFEDSSGNKHVKLIKNTALWSDAWNEDIFEDVDWNESDLYNSLNGGGFLNNSYSYSYMQSSTWLNKIVTWTYTMTNTKTVENYLSNSIYGPEYSEMPASNVYLHELNRSSKSSKGYCYFRLDGVKQVADCNAGEWKTHSSKIGLMYVSDYLLSLGSDSSSTGWMDRVASSASFSLGAWTMTRQGKFGTGWYYAWCVSGSSAYTSKVNESSDCGVIPVFYLASDVELASGSGGENYPYIIKE